MTSSTRLEDAKEVKGQKIPVEGKDMDFAGRDRLL